MTTIDIPLPDALTEPLSQPRCVDIKLPKPSMPELVLPTGAALKGLADFTRGIPTECSMNFSLVLMIAPIMASLECPLKILKLVSDLINAAESGNPMKLLTVLTDAKDALQSCLGLVTPAGICPFIKSLLLLIVRILNCFLQEMRSVIGMIEGISLNLSAVLESGNTDAAAALQCALENAQNTAAGTLSSIQPVAVLLQIAQPFFDIAQIKLDPLPDVSGSSGIEGLKEAVQTLTPVVSTIEAIIKELPC
jgi:hypothetical protein